MTNTTKDVVKLSRYLDQLAWASQRPGDERKNRQKRVVSIRRSKAIMHAMRHPNQAMILAMAQVIRDSDLEFEAKDDEINYLIYSVRAMKFLADMHQEDSQEKVKEPISDEGLVAKILRRFKGRSK